MTTLEELEETGNTIKDCDKYRAQLVAKRTKLVRQARNEGNTWRKLAIILGMTEHGLIKASKQ